MPFSAIVGHQRLLALLARAVDRDTLPQSVLLAGPSGVGKRAIAVALAEAVNCLDPKTSPATGRDACGTCTACRRIGRLAHPDVIVLEPDDKGTIGIDPVREVIDKSGYRPFEGRRRVVIVDDADAMTAPAQSALLKILEEPPSASMFVLVSSMPDSLLATVRSRCPRLRVGALTLAEIEQVLVRDHQYSEQEARAAAADADGSVGRALAAEASDTAQAIADARELLALAVRADASRRIQALKDMFPKKSTPAADREHLASRLRAAASLVRDLGVLVVGGDRSLLAHVDAEAELSRLASAFDADRATRTYAVLDQALAALDRNASAKVVADWVAVQL